MSMVRIFARIAAPLTMGFVAASADAAAPSWPAVTNETRPWVYNWWMGSAVDADGLEAQ